MEKWWGDVLLKYLVTEADDTPGALSNVVMSPSVRNSNL